MQRFAHIHEERLRASEPDVEEERVENESKIKPKI